MATAVETNGRSDDADQPFVTQDGWLTQTDRLARVIYWGIHLSCLLVVVVGAPLEAVLLCAATYLVRVFGITGGYHRYFSHRTYKTGRVFQFVLAWLGCAATQKGPLWWSGTHRLHHRHSDQPGDPHSPTEGLWHSHQGWIFESRWGGTPADMIPDFTRYPELEWLNRWHFVPPLTLAVLCYAIAGGAGLVWGFAISTTLLWHGTYCVNSLCHIWGTRPYDTPDGSRNNAFVALITLGEGWHNNHHHYQASARNGFRWWEVDGTWYILKGLEAVGLVWDLRTPPAAALDRTRGSDVDISEAA